MTIVDTNIIDMVGYNRQIELCTLGVSDHLLWSDDHHLEKLQNKLNSYLNFITSGQAEEQFKPNPIKEYKIIIYTKHAPNQAAKDFLAAFQQQISRVSDKIFLEYK